MLPFLLPMASSAIGAGLGAIADKKHRGMGALKGGLAGLGLGMGLKTGMPTGILSAGKTMPPAVPVPLSVNDPNFSDLSDALAGLGKPGLGSQLKKIMPFAPLALGALGGMHQTPQTMNPTIFPMQSSPIPTDPMSQSMGRPFAPPVQLSMNQPRYGGYFG